eukprot:12881217-Prorocentrum_lima.AAC.1
MNWQHWTGEEWSQRFVLLGGREGGRSKSSSSGTAEEECILFAAGLLVSLGEGRGKKHTIFLQDWENPKQEYFSFLA